MNAIDFLRKEYSLLSDESLEDVIGVNMKLDIVIMLMDKYADAKQKLNIHGVMQAVALEGDKEATVASEGQGEANTCADVWPNCVHKFEERIDGEWMCIYCGKRA